MSDNAHIINEITKAWKADQERKPVPVTADELPISYESLTPEWLTNALCGAHPGAKVESLQLQTPDNGSANRMKIRVEYNEAGEAAGLPKALFCKASHDLANRIVLGVSGAAHCETTFYNKIAPHLDIVMPRAYFAKFDPKSFNSLVVLNDLAEENSEFCDHRTVVTRERAESQMALLGKLHGTSYSHPEIRRVMEELPTWQEFFERTLNFGMKEGSEQGFITAEEAIPSSIYRRQKEIWPATVESVKRHSALPQMLAHGDVHLKNWFIAANGEMGLSDWQCATRGSWCRDFAYTISTALTIESRRAWEKDLLQLYLDRLQQAGGPKIPFDEAWDHYRQQLMTALMYWTVTLTPAPGLPDMQPKDITLEFIRRIATAMEDLETLDSF